MAPELDDVDALAQISFLVQGTLERRAGEHGLSLIRRRLLGILRDRTPTMNELARLLGLDKSSTSGLVDRAQRRGLVAAGPLTARPPLGARPAHRARQGARPSRWAPASLRTSRRFSNRYLPMIA